MPRIIYWILTYFLACWMSFAVCIGLAVAAVAGVAYGYNYQMAEWLTFTRSDAMVYMRRGQFYERPDVRAKFMARRSGDEDEGFPSGLQENEGSDDQLPGEEGNLPDTKSNALPESWSGVKGAENFMDKLHKYNYPPPSVVRSILQDNAVQAEMSTEANPYPLDDYYKLTSLPSRLLKKLISISPNVAMSTAIIKSGDSKIIMRNFHVPTMKDVHAPIAYKPNQLDYVYRDEQDVAAFRRKDSENDKDSKDFEKHLDPRIHIEYPTRSTDGNMIMRHWVPTTTPMFQDYTAEVDEDNIVYRPG